MALIPVRNLEVLIITKYRAEEPDIINLPVVQTYIQGAQSIQSEVFLTGELNYTSWEQAGQSPTWPELQVHRYPTIIFIDKDTSMQITRLTGGQITVSAVAELLVDINRLQRDAAGNYFDADGNWLADIDTTESVFSSPIGMGILSIGLSNVLWMVGGIVALWAISRK